ncbi:MAG: serine/threonine protein kinase [Anaerolineae bacterium]|nr:serine/threonine protein kinase [Anaerolineae bacterium]
MSLQGQTLGKYRVLDPLGRGGMARVYRGYHPSLDRYVAIKVLRSDLVEDDAFLARFEREARAVASLRHPHIVSVHDFDVQGDIYYMVMELLEGDSLKTRLNDYRARGERMPIAEAARTMLDILDGLAYAHSEGMVHRDIKPGNIMLSKRGRAILTDFGIAHIVGGTRYTVSGALMGTLNYMAPEQGLEGRCDARCDIYALGVVFYEMLTQKVPFDADTPLAILLRHLNDPLPLPREIVPEIPQPVERVVLKALAKRPEDRFPSAEAMSTALSAALTEAGIEPSVRVSMPRSFTTAQAPAVSVVVASGTARAEFANAPFAGDETDADLGLRLDAERAEQLAVRGGVTSLDGPGRAELSRSLTIASTLVSGVSAVASRLLPGVSRFLTAEGKGRTARAILSGIGVVAVYNLIAVWIDGLTGWWTLLGRGWPMELIAAALGLCVIVYATKVVWLFIPAGILLGNGLIFAYCQVTGRWAQWALLWPLEPLIIGASIWLAFRLAREGSTGREIARPLGCALGVLSGVWIAIITLAMTLAAAADRVFGR